MNPLLKAILIFISGIILFFLLVWGCSTIDTLYPKFWDMFGMVFGIIFMCICGVSLIYNIIKK